jgi:hypothetical protein
MSAIAAARKRRAPETVPPPQFSQQQQQLQQLQQQRGLAQTGSNPSMGLTLPQVIEVIDKRLSALEKTATAPATSSGEIPSNLNAILEEYNSRHELMADEIHSLRKENETLKMSLIELQTFTMEVNKKLLDHVLTIAAESAASANA